MLINFSIIFSKQILDIPDCKQDGENSCASIVQKGDKKGTLHPEEISIGEAIPKLRNILSIKSEQSDIRKL